MPKKGYLNSLRFRYLISALALVVVVVVGSYLAAQQVQHARAGISSNLKVHHQLIENISRIRTELLDSYTYIDAYLLEPEKKQYRQFSFVSIDKAINLARGMTKYSAYYQFNELAHINELMSLLEDYKEKTNELFEIRGDSRRQFPSLAEGNLTMQPNRNALNNAIALALQEIKDENGIGSKNYIAFIELRHLWTQMLSNFRLYLANRMGSFNETALPVQEKAIETLHQQFSDKVKQIQKLDDSGALGFQTSEAFAIIKKSSRGWYSGYKKVKEIHHSKEWRIDSKIMKEQIVPHIDHMSTLLFVMEKGIMNSISHEVEQMADVASSQTDVLKWVSLILVLFLLLIYLSINRLIMLPLREVSRALRSEGTGKESVVLPTVTTQETAELFSSFTEMANRIQRRQLDLEYQALHDSLTALPNRIFLQNRIEYEIQTSSFEQLRPVSVLLIDLDRFKEINDSLGHHIGDEILIDVGLKLTAALSTKGVVARLGGDEYAAVLPGLDSNAAINECKTILKAFDEPLHYNDMNLYINMSIGIASYPEHSNEVDTLIQYADIAMYEAKSSHSKCAVYNPETDNHSRGRLQIISQLHEDIENNRLEVFFQPIVDLQKDRVVGVESLLRWKHPERGYLPPDYVIELAEHTGLIMPLTYWVIDKAIEQIELVHKQGFDLSVSINISVYNLKDLDFVTKVESIIASHTVKPEQIVFEITENAMMSNPAHATRLLNQLDAMGICLAVDDFGTGFSSLTYLKQLPVDELKIDKSFVLGMKSDDSSDEVIVRSTIDLAHNLGLQAVAEGVENDDVAERLGLYGCDLVQGFHYTRPLPLEQFLHWLQQRGR